VTEFKRLALVKHALFNPTLLLKVENSTEELNLS
jgi:hypothetical protein